MSIKVVIGKMLKYLSLIIWTLVMVLPLLTVLFGSFKTNIEFNSTPGIALPESFANFDNYIQVFNAGKIFVGFFNSFVLVLFGVAGSVFVGSMVAYTISRFEFKYKKVVLFLYLIVSIVPLEISQVSTFKIVNAMGLYNTRLAAILLYVGADVLMVYIYLQAFDRIPREFDKAAILEGANYIQVYSKIILPLLKPATATVVMLKTIAIYNDFYIPFLYMPGEGLRTVSTTLFTFVGAELTQWHIISACIVISVIPMIIFFVVLQKYIFTGITSGGIR